MAYIGLDMLQALKMTHWMWVHSGLVRSSSFPLLHLFFMVLQPGALCFVGAASDGLFHELLRAGPSFFFFFFLFA